MTWRSDLSSSDSLPMALADLRGNGWLVAAHNDYHLSGHLMTFWLFTHPNGRFVKGEAFDDRAAVVIARDAAMVSQ